MLYYVVFHVLGEKIDISVADVSTIIPALLTTIQSDMFIKAKAGRDEKMATVLKWEDFVPALERDCLVLTPFCDLAEWEDKVKVRLLINANLAVSHYMSPCYH